jgi:hypothetical protein
MECVMLLFGYRDQKSALCLYFYFTIVNFAVMFTFFFLPQFHLQLSLLSFLLNFQSALFRLLVQLG